MQTIEEDINTQIIEKKSKSIADLCYVSSSQEAQNKLQEIRKKHYDAKHHCFAYRIDTKEGIIEKASDDGEPSGTAGAPMLSLLQKSNLSNVIIIVTRYFGGILLGTGGLVRAYTLVAKNAIESAKRVEEKYGLEIQVTIPYQNTNLFKHYCKINQITIIETKFEQEVSYIIQVAITEKDKIMKELETTGINIQNVKILQEKKIKK